MHVEPDVHAYVQNLETHLQQTLFGCGIADPEGAVLLVRGALATGDPARAAELADQTRRLAATTPGHPDMAAAADHARGLTDQDPVVLERAAQRYRTALGRAGALEDAGQAWVGRGDQDQATTLLSEAYALYQEVGDDGDLARVRSGLRAAGTRPRHWTHADRPAFGWGSLTGTERRIADLVAEGLSNRQVANRVFLSTHTVAFHLRHIFWKLDITSRVQLARLAAELGRPLQARLDFETRPQVGCVGLLEHGDQAVHPGQVMQQGAHPVPGQPAAAGDFVQVDGLTAVLLLGFGERTENLLVIVAVVGVIGELPLCPVAGRDVPSVNVIVVNDKARFC